MKRHFLKISDEKSIFDVLAILNTATNQDNRSSPRSACDPDKKR
jgi:hypothetical protein